MAQTPCRFRLGHHDGVECSFMALAAISFVALIAGIGALLIG